MKPAQQLIDEVRRFLKGTRRDLTPAVEELFTEFREQTIVANQRLRHCHQLISSGFPAEAIQKAEEQPPVVELAAVLGSLDEADLNEINEVLAFNDQPPIDPIALECLEQINDVYNQYAGVADHLSQFRLMNLQRRSLKDRLAKLRQICQQQMDDLSWSNDLKAFEAARLTEIQSDFRAAVKSRDQVALKDLFQEVSGSPWTVSVPTGLAQSIRTSAVQVEREQSTNRLREIARELFDVLNSRDLEAGERLTEEWDLLQKSAQLPANDPSVIESSPAREWVAEERRRHSQNQEFNQLLQQFERMLFAPGVSSNGKSHQQLQQCLHQLERFDYEIPPKLMKRYQQRDDLQASLTRRKTLLFSSAVGICVLLIAAGIGWAVINYQARSRMESAMTSVQALLDQGNAAGARQLYDSQSEKWTSPEWLALASAIDTVSSERESLIARLSQWYLDADRATSIAQLDDLVKTAKVWYETTPFKTSVDPEFQTKVLQIRHRLSMQLAEREGILRGQIKRLQDLLPELSNAARDLAAQERFVALDRQVATEISEIEKGLSGLNPSLAQQLTTIRAAASEQRLEHTRLKEQKELIKGILTASNIPTTSSLPAQALKTYYENLLSFAARYPDDAISIQFKNVPSKGAMEQLLSWQSLMRANGGLEPTSKPDCEQRLEQLAAFEKTITTPLIEGKTAKLRAYWEHIRDRDEQSLARFMTARHMSGVYVIDVNDWPRDGDVTRFYTKEKETFDKDGANIKFFRMKNGVFEEDTRLVSSSKLKSRTPLLAPHSKMAEEIRDTVRLIRIPEWETRMLELLKKVYTTEQIDPILRGRLVYEILQIASRGSLFLDQHLKEFIDRFDNDRFDFNVDWCDPTNEFAATHREYATTLLKGIPIEAIIERFADAEQEKKAFLHQRDGLYSVVGAVLPDDEQKLHPQFSVDTEKLRPSDILILRKAGEVDELLPVGFVQQGEFQSTASSFDTLGGVLLLARPKESAP